MFENIAVGIIVLIAVLGLTRHYIKKNKQPGCSGCSGCPIDPETGERTCPSVNIDFSENFKKKESQSH